MRSTTSTWTPRGEPPGTGATPATPDGPAAPGTSATPDGPAVPGASATPPVHRPPRHDEPYPHQAGWEGRP